MEKVQALFQEPDDPVPPAAKVIGLRPASFQVYEHLCRMASPGNTVVATVGEIARSGGIPRPRVKTELTRLQHEYHMLRLAPVMRNHERISNRILLLPEEEWNKVKKGKKGKATR